MRRDPRARLPSVDRILAAPELATLLERFGRERVADVVRAELDERRAAIVDGSFPMGADDPATYAPGARARLEAEDVRSLRPVVNATGVVLHTNLGRAPLASVAIEAMREAALGYTNLEYDLEEGRRGSRYAHCAALLTELTGADDGLVVNNAAAGLVLALNTLARGSGVVVSRGELIEIGGGFRIPEVLERAGATLVEVGSTNRTRTADYRAAIDGQGVAAILKVHRSNFRVTGFTEEASLEDLRELADAAQVPLIHDLGSGLLADAAALGLPHEPTPRDSVRSGADVVVFSGDKLLGGPQAGLVVGRGAVVEAMRRNPLCRALRVDKVTLAGLEATLRLYRRSERAREDIPVLAMLGAPADRLRARAHELAQRLAAEGGGPCTAEPVTGAVGGGTYPGVEIESWALVPELPYPAHEAARLLRGGDPPVVGRVVDDRLVLDLRTVLPEQEPVLLERVAAIQRGSKPAP